MVTYADPDSAFATLNKIIRRQREFRNILGDTITREGRERICRMAALMAPTYINGNTTESLEFYAGHQFDNDVADYALEALAWQSLFGDNGSDGQHAASYAMRWADNFRK